MFQPSMMGNLEAGLAEAMDYVFKHFTPEDQLLLANNVFLTGGTSQFPGNIRFIIFSRVPILQYGRNNFDLKVKCWRVTWNKKIFLQD